MKKNKLEATTIRQVLVEEWFTKSRTGKVYMHWRFKNGKEVKQLIPYSEIPVVSWPLKTEER